MEEKLNLPVSLQGDLWLYRNLGWENKQHRHAELEFNLVLSGTGLYLLEDRKFRISAGALLWLFPAQEHVLIGESPDYAMWVGYFNPAMISQVTKAGSHRLLRETNPAGEFFRRVSIEVMTQLDTVISRVMGSRDRVDEFNEGLHFLLLTLWHAFEESGLISEDALHPAVERAARFIRENPDSSLTLADIASHAGLCSARLSALFHRQTGITMVKYRNKVRISRFLHLYGNGQRRNMLDAALSAGFGSYPQFNRVFKEVMGCAPAEYRKHPGGTRPIR